MRHHQTLEAVESAMDDLRQAADAVRRETELTACQARAELARMGETVQGNAAAMLDIVTVVAVAALVMLAALVIVHGWELP